MSACGRAGDGCGETDDPARQLMTFALLVLMCRQTWQVLTNWPLVKGNRTVAWQQSRGSSLQRFFSQENPDKILCFVQMGWDHIRSDKATRDYMRLG